MHKPMPVESALALDHISVRYDGKPALEAVSAHFPVASMSAIIGPNGAGKSSLLKAALGLIAHGGAVRVFGGTLALASARIAYVPQRASVDWDFPAHVSDVVAMGLYRELGLLGRPNAAQKARIATSLERVGMADYARRQIGQLSGGQQQRVFLARAIAQNADLLLLDEPLAGVDAATESAIIALLKQEVAAGRTVIAVHHDLSTVAAYFERVLLINTRNIAEGPVATHFTPEALRETFGRQILA